jgi:adenylate cyclase
MFGGLSGLNRILGELRRRRVLRLVGVYVFGVWLILQVSDVVLDIIGAPEGALRMVAVVLAVGFPLAIVIAWIYDLTPAGVVRTRTAGAGAAADGKVDRHPLWWLWIGFLALLASLAVIVYSVAQQRHGRMAPAEVSIAVLPFADLSPDGDHRYFSDGLSEALMDSLSRIQGLQVSARTASFAFRDPDRDIREVAGALEVAHLVEGSVRKAGNDLRINARLVDGRTGRNLWNASFDASLEDVFLVQDNISRGIAEALQIRLLGSETLVPAFTVDPDAYEEYLRGRAELRREGTAQSAERAAAHFRRALELEQSFTPALAGLCTAYWEQYSITRDAELADRAIHFCIEAEHDPDPPAELLVALGGLYRGTGQLERSRELLDRAVAAHPNDAEVHAALGETARASGDLEAARTRHLRAIELDPAYWRYHWNLGRALVDLGRLDEAAARINRAIRLQPDSPAPYYSLGGIYFYQGEYLQSADAFRQSIVRHPNPVAYSNAGTQYFYAGDYVQAEEMFRQAVALSPADFRYHAFLAETIELQAGDSSNEARQHYEEAIRLGYQQLSVNPEDHLCRAAVAGYLAQVGRGAEARAELKALDALERSDMLIHRALAMAHLNLGEHEDAVRHFALAAAEGYPPALFERDPRLAVLQRYPEFQKLLTADTGS